MRLSKFSKKWIAYICAIAMVVAGLAFVPAADTKADAPDWSTIDYLGDGAGGGQYSNKYKYYCEDGSAVNIQKPGFADEAGIYATFPGADIQMDIEGYAVQGAGACLYLSNFTQKVTEINITYAGGSTKAYVYYEDGEEGPTTTVDPSAPTAEPTTANPWKSIPNGGSQWYYNNSTKQNISSVVNIQKPGWAAEDGVYITVPAGISEVNVNGDTEGVAAIDGAGFVVYLSAMTKKINEVTVTQGLGTSYIQIMNENGSEDPTEETTEAPTEETTEAPTEAPSEETTEAPTEAPSEETTEAPSEETTEAPAGDWLSAKDQWVLRKDDGSFDVIADGGATYDGFEGIASFYSGSWGGGDVDVKTPASTDPNKLDIRVNSVGTGDWSMQVHINKTGLDATKAYSVTLTSGETTLLEETVSEISTYAKTVNLANKLAVGETTLVLDIEEQTMPPAPVVQDITITPNEAQIETNYNIWASWTNPTDTTKAYAYLKQADAGYDVMAANGWDFNTQATQPMTSVDNVDHSKNNEVKVEEGGTYVFIVDTYDAWNRPTGHGEIEITIPSLTPEEKEAKEYLEKINTAENLALNKTPMVAEGNKEADAKNFCDGNNGTRWQANKTVDNTWFAVDLGAVYTVDKVLVSWEASNARAYEVYLAGEDGIYDEQPAATVSGLANNTAVYKLSKDINTSARYVKVLVTEWSQNAQDYGISPYELAVFGAETPTESTEAPSVEPSTEAPEPGIDMNIDILSPETDNNTAVGGYTVYSGGWASVTGKAGVDANNSDHIKVVQNTNNNWERWGLQIIKSISGLTAGETYTVEWKIKADSNDGRVKPDFDGQGDTPTELTGAEQTLTGTVTANDAGVVKMVIGAGNVGYGNAIEYFQPILKDSSGAQVYPAEEPSTEAPSVEPSTETPSESPTVEPSTEAPSESPTVEPSTEAPTEVTTQAPTQEPTTQAPTQKPTQAPTVAPTVPKPVPVIKIPDKAKVKKAVKKKKSAKKIKVKIKKVKGAKGYQVAVYKTKKKAKKNKKALVKKYTTKTKLTIKSKKFKKKKKLYVKVRAYTLDGTVKVFGAWSKPKKTKKK